MFRSHHDLSKHESSCQYRESFTSKQLEVDENPARGKMAEDADSQGYP